MNQYILSDKNLSGLIRPLIRTINEMCNLSISTGSIFYLLEQKPFEVTFLLTVDEQDVALIGRVMTTILLKGGLLSQLAEHNPSVDPIRFMFQKRVLNNHNEISVCNILHTMVDPGYNKRAARSQIAVLRAILSDKRNLLQVTESAILPHAYKPVGFSKAA